MTATQLRVSPRGTLNSTTAGSGKPFHRFERVGGESVEFRLTICVVSVFISGELVQQCTVDGMTHDQRLAAARAFAKAWQENDGPAELTDRKIVERFVGRDFANDGRLDAFGGLRAQLIEEQAAVRKYIETQLAAIALLASPSLRSPSSAETK